MTPPIPPNPGRHSPPDVDPFRYGWREVQVTRPNGTTIWDMVPLTLEDVLHPQENDHIPENTRHERLRRHFQNVFERRLVRTPTRLSLSDCLIDWDRSDVRGHSPDLIVLEKDDPWPWRSWGTLHVKQERAWPLLIAEIVSPSTRSNDVEIKKSHYYLVVVPIYTIVDQETEDDPLSLYVYQWTPGGYELLAPDVQGRVLIESLGVTIAVVGDRIAIYDASTGQELGDYQAVCEALEAEVKARQEAERKAMLAEAARQAAEARVKEQEHARLLAEQRAREHEQARQVAEREAEASNRRIQELEELLRQRNDSTQP
jgi:colicin import membrane protein